MHEEMKKFIYSSYRQNYSTILDYGFYEKLAPSLQTDLINQLFKETICCFADFFRECDQGFVNRVLVSFSLKSFHNEQLIQSANAFCHEIYFVRKGRVVVCEPTCYQEPILVYRKGTVFNVYQVLLNTQLELVFKA